MSQPPSSTPGNPRQLRPSVLMLISTVIIGSWFVMWAVGVFERMGDGAAMLILGGDVVALGILWGIFVRRDLGRRG